MALIKCTECSREISDSAGKCPQCGAKVKKSAGIFGWIIAAMLLAAIIQGASSGEKSKEQAAAVNTANTPEQRAAEAKQKQIEEVRFQKATLVARSIKSSLRNPDSVTWEDIYSNNDGSVICILYRAQNGFGGMSREHATYFKEKLSQSAETWNKRCTGSGFIDLKYVRQAI